MINGVNVYTEWYECTDQERGAASKRLFILVHGIFSSTFSFLPLLPELRKSGDVLAVDLPGFGKSEKGRRAGFSYQDYANLLEDLLQKVAAEKTIIAVGHSMGGQVLLRLAKGNSSLLHQLVLLAPSLYLPQSKLAFRYVAKLPFFSQWLKRYIKKKRVEDVLKSVFYDPAFVTKERIAAYEEPLKEPSFYRSLSRFIFQREGDLDSAEIQELTLPILVIWGKEDRILPVKLGRRFCHDIAHASLVELEHTGHLLSEEKPERVAAEIRDFINHYR